MSEQAAPLDAHSNDPHEATQVLRSAKIIRIAWLPVPLLLMAIVAARLIGFNESHRAETLTLLLGFVFYILVSLGALFLVARSFLASGSPGLLFLECGLVIWGLAGTVGDAFSRGDVNAVVTIYNVGILLAGLCLLLSATLLLRPQRALRSRTLLLVIGWTASMVVLWLVTQATLANWLPVFFITGQGGTPVRYWVLVSAILAFALSAGLSLSGDGKKSAFTSWYAMALLLLSVGLFGIMIQLSLGSVVNWLSRSAQWLGGVYLLLSAIASLSESRLTLLPAPEKLPRSAYYRGAVAVALVLAAAALRLTFLGAMGLRAPYVIFFPAVVCAAIYGGMRSGLVAVGLSVLLANYLWVEPVGQLTIAHTADWLALFVFFLSGVMVVWVANAMRRATARASAAEAHALLSAERESVALALQKSEERYHTLFTGMNEGFAIHELLLDESGKPVDWRFLDVNPAFERLTGLSRKTVVGKTHNEVLPGDDTSWLEIYSKVALTGQPVQFVNYAPTLARYFEVLAYRPAPMQFAVILMDVTERRRVETDLLQAKDQLAFDLDAMTRLQRIGTLFLREGNLQPVLDEIVDAAIAISGADFGNIQLMDAETSTLKIVAHRGFPEWWIDYWESVSKGHGACGTALERGERVIIEDVEQSPIFVGTPALDIQLKAGVHAVQCTPLISRSGEPVGMFSTHFKKPHRPDERTLGLLDILARQALDIIERWHAEEAIRKARDELEVCVEERTLELSKSYERLEKELEERRRLITAIEQSAEGVLVLDQSLSKILYANPSVERLSGYASVELIDGDPRRLRSDRRGEDFYESVRSEIAKGKAWSGDYPLRCRDGSEILAEMTVSPVRDEQGVIGSYVATVHDVSEKRLLEDQLREAQKMEAIGTLTGGIAHDFNNILAGMIGFTEMSLDDIPPDNPAQRHLELVLKSGFRARDLIRQMLSFSRRDSYEIKAIPLPPIIKETVKLLRATIPSTIQIDLDTGAKSHTVLANATGIQQIIMNLATNAAYAMRETGGRLGITLFEVGPYVQLAVEDTGVGMDTEVQKRIFEPFFTTKEPGQGTGMGLAVVYGIVKSLHGDITVESRPNAGSVFRILFPKAETDEQPEDSMPAAMPTGHGRILFVDDEQMLAELGQGILERLGYTVASVTNSSEALKLFHDHPSDFDLVITDQTMPELTGMRLASEMLLIRSDLPIILCTGHSDGVNPVSVRAAGIKQFLMKPLSKQDLAVAVKKALDTGTCV
ncbi:MAG TPA: PAS domain S-box protein [Syntrophorhabdaceae bacterium]|nr:PAS domain S-box protein [Syntrophorhabdaceae bacterium]